MNLHPRDAVAAFLLAAPLATQEPSLLAPGLQDVRAVLLRRSLHDNRTPAELVTGLAALGADAVPALYGLVTGRELGALCGDWQPSDWKCLPEEIPVLGAQALSGAPTSVVVEHLARALDQEPNLQERLVILRILSGQGSAEGLDLVWRSAGELEELGLSSPSVARALCDALVAILREDRRSWTSAEQRLEKLAPASLEVLLTAIGEAGQPRGMELLARLFASGSPPRSRVVEAMAELELACPWTLAGRTLEHCSAWLTSPDAAECAHAARLAGRLHALEAVPALIELVSHIDELVRRCAVDALQRMAGLPLDQDANAWSTWHEGELSWRQERWDTLLATLVSGRPGPANEALRELAAHPLFRHEMARSLADSLSQQPRAVALSACAELERLGSRWSLPGLVAVLEGAEPELRDAARRALSAFTGESRERAVEPWRALVGS